MGADGDAFPAIPEGTCASYLSVAVMLCLCYCFSDADIDGIGEILTREGVYI